MTLSYLYLLPIDVIAHSGMVATDAAVIVMGGFGAGFIAMMVIFSTMGTTNGNILATSRISFAMAQENRFFKSAGVIHPRFKTPGNALLIHGVWTSILVLSGSFDMLTDMLIFVSWLFYGLSAFGIFILRKKMPDAPRPYRIWGYPFVPAAFVCFTLFFLVVTLCNDIMNYSNGNTALVNSLFGLLLTSTGIPLYWYFKGTRNAQ
jgi:APA family basic amino acid/polyamine antiporter